jgi:hypothetical protein
VAKLNAKSDGVSVDGLARLRRDLKAVSGDAAKELSAAGKDVASFVADDARGAASGLGGVAAHVAPSIRAAAAAGGGAIALGGAAYPMAAGAEFGGQGRPTTQQFKPHLGRTGYFVYPTIRRDSDRIESEFLGKLDDLMRKYDLT